MIYRSLALLCCGLFLACAVGAPPTTTLEERDQWGCYRPAGAVTLNKYDINVAAIEIGTYKFGGLKYDQKPEIQKLVTDADAGALAIDYLICVGEKRGDATNPVQKDHLRRYLMMLRTNPTAAEAQAWQDRNPFPK